MFHQDAGDAMMSAPDEMETKISWTTGRIIHHQLSTITINHHLPEDRRGHHPPTVRCVTISASQMEVALQHTSDDQDLVSIKEAASLMTLAEAVPEHQMSVVIATRYSLVLRKKKRNQLLIPDIQAVCIFALY